MKGDRAPDRLVDAQADLIGRYVAQGWRIPLWNLVCLAWNAENVDSELGELEREMLPPLPGDDYDNVTPDSYNPALGDAYPSITSVDEMAQRIRWYMRLQAGLEPEGEGLEPLPDTDDGFSKH